MPEQCRKFPYFASLTLFTSILSFSLPPHSLSLSLLSFSLPLSVPHFPFAFHLHRPPKINPYLSFLKTIYIWRIWVELQSIHRQKATIGVCIIRPNAASEYILPAEQLSYYITYVFCVCVSIWVCECVCVCVFGHIPRKKLTNMNLVYSMQTNVNSCPIEYLRPIYAIHFIGIILQWFIWEISVVNSKYLIFFWNSNRSTN